MPVVSLYAFTQVVCILQVVGNYASVQQNSSNCPSHND